jgi:cell division protein FtsI/penicillin-binding protein 2
VIDPILQTTYLGGNGSDYAYALAIHPTTGEVYVAGETWSTDLPKTTGGAQASYGGGDSDAFVARLSADLRTLRQSTYLGGSKSDGAYALAIHPTTGEVYVAGETWSTDLPKTTGGAQASYGGGDSDAFVARLSADLRTLRQSTYLGGSKSDGAYALAIHPTTGEVYVAGSTYSNDFPGTSGGAQGSYRGYHDAILARLNKDLTQILQSTYLAGSKIDEALAIVIHPTTGEVYVAGYTWSTDFPKTTGGAQASYGGGDSDAFVARLSADLRTLRQSTYLGGSDLDVVNALAIHPTTGEVYVVGTTQSINFPGTSGGAQASYGGGDSDAFVARLNKDLTQILQSTYLGGSKSDYAHALAIHPTTGEVYVAGRTESIDLPKTTGGAQASHNGGEDALAARLNKDLTQLLQSTYLGGSDLDKANALAIHPTTGEVYLAGYTSSNNFPKTTGSAQANYGGGDYDAFVARLSADLAAGRGFGGGCGCPMTSSTSSKASLWNILVWLSFPAFVVARRIRKK